MVKVKDSGVIFGPFNETEFFAIESAVDQKKTIQRRCLFS